MASSSNSGDVFDIRRIRRLVELMNEHELSEIDLRNAEMRVRIRRGPEQAAPVIEQRQIAPAPLQPQTAGDAAPSQAAEDSTKYQFIKSPTVGTFYSAPEPGEPAFVKVGDMVSADTTVCVVEAMKVFNAIPAEISGRIVATLVENEQPVEYNQPLFKVDPG